MYELKSNTNQIILKLKCHISSLEKSNNPEIEIQEILRLVYILKYIMNRKNPPANGGGVLQMSLSL